ncbi:uncharacterized protein [Periplaneta americana]|uniref:uncharacterized protein isoform X2 n=1 Tax=Periplaneta americana TaxID=6978 RepID=UPI0037E91818
MSKTITKMRLNIGGIVLAAILLQCSCTELDCNNMFRETPYGQYECYQEGNDVETGDEDCESLFLSNTFSVENTSNGTVSFTFDLLPESCKFRHYYLTLFIDESVTSEEQCSKVTFFESQHSFRRIKIIRSEGAKKRNVHSFRAVNVLKPEDAVTTEVSPCGQKMTVTFNYIYTACYMVDVEAKKSSMGDDFVSNYTQPIFLETEYKKNLLIGKKARIASQYLPIERALLFSLLNYKELNITRMDVVLRECTSYPCICGHGTKRHWWEMALSMSGNLMCKFKNKLMNRPTFKLVNNEMRWTVGNVTNGNYCILVEFMDDRCERNTVWNNDSYCLYNSRIVEVLTTVQPYPLKEELPMNVAPLFTILVTSFSVLLVMCVCVLLYVWRRRQPRPEPDTNCDIMRQPPSNRPQILLLYARDCEPFMDLMVTFRELLKEETKCEVKDCFDPELTEDIARGQVEWLTRQIINPEMKIVLVETECAVFHQQALLKHKKTSYTKPKWGDNLFDYGLKVLRDDLQKSTYQKVFVVRINGYTEEKGGMLHLTPYTRYVIPQSLEKLLSSLYQFKHCESRITPCSPKYLTRSSVDYVLILDETNDSHLQKLHQEIKNFENYKKQNQDYLKKLVTWT